MSVDYKAIADDLQGNHTVIFDAAIAHLDIKHPTKSRKAPYEEIMEGGKFMDISFVENAFNAIKDKTENLDFDDSKITLALISESINYAAADKLEEIVDLMVADGVVKSWVADAIRGDGVNGRKLKNKLTSKINDYGITQAVLDGLSYVGFKYKRLKAGHVQNALQKRHAGLI